MGNETTITQEQARTLVTAEGFDAYGPTRVYAVWNEQIVGVKSGYHVDKYAGATRWYMVNSLGLYPPVARA